MSIQAPTTDHKPPTLLDAGKEDTDAGVNLDFMIVQEEDSGERAQGREGEQQQHQQRQQSEDGRENDVLSSRALWRRTSPVSAAASSGWRRGFLEHAAPSEGVWRT